MAQKLLLDSQITKLKANGTIAAAKADGSDLKPVVKFFSPDGAATWLIAEMGEDGDTLFGLCDLGMGSPELGYVSLSELKSVRGKMNLPIERDMHFTADKTMAEYAKEARNAGRITV